MTVRNPINMAHLNVLEIAPPEVVTLAEQAGFDTLGLRLSPVREGEVAPPVYGNTAMKRDLAARLKDSNVGLFEIEVLWLRHGVTIGDYRPFLELGAELGAKHVISICDLADETAAIEMYSRGCELCAEYGLTLGLEFLPWLAVGTLEGAKRIVTSARQANGHLILDSLHISRTGGDYATAAKVPHGLMRYVQISDAPLPPPASIAEIAEEAKFNRLAPGEGDLPLTAFCESIPATMPVSVEVAFAPSRGLSPLERSKLAFTSTRDLLDKVADSRGAA